MHTIKRTFVILLAALMLLACFACGDKTEQPTAEPTAVAQADTPKPTEAPTPKPTEVPTEEPTAEPTEEPTPEPLKQGDLDEAFLALDNELFVWYVSDSILSLDHYCRHPENFGINEADVPVTLGSVMDDEEADESEYVAWKEKLLAIDRNGLSDHMQFAYDNYLAYFDQALAAVKLEYNYEPLEQYVGIHVNLPLTFGLYDFYDQQDVENYMTLLQDVPRFFDEILAYEQKRAELGLFMTQDALDQVLDEINSVAKSGRNSFLHTTFKEAMEKADYLTDEQKQDYIKQNDQLVNTVWVDSYKKLYDGLKKLRKQCREAVGAYEQGGTAYDYFCWKIQRDGNNNRTVDDAVAFLGEYVSEYYDLMYDSAMNAIGQLQEFRPITTGSIGGDETYLKKLMPKIVPAMPDVEVEYVEVPKELQDGFSPAAYKTPAFDDYQHNVILTNPADKDHYDMSTLAHEGYPGHMFMYTYQYALGTIPKFQFVIDSIGYSEAWSTNSEFNIARINERYNADYATYSFMAEEFTNAVVMYCSLIVNGQGASKKTVKTYLSRWNMGDYTDEIYDLVITMPIYYVKYVIGFTEQYALTERCKQKLGDKFDSVAFYEEYLSWGPGRFDLLSERMDAWAAAQ